jgi:serine/threonine-protein kinase
MPNVDDTGRSDLNSSTDSSRNRRGDQSAQASAGTDVDAADQTVISASPPHLAQPDRPAFNARELGRALEGRQLDHVLLEQFVGGGGMGAVFRAWDTDLYRTVAVKVLSAYQVGDIESQRRFQTEARSAARLDHPNIARVHYVGEDSGIRYIVFEYIEGANVRDLVLANGPLPVPVALNYTLQISNALTHAWEREVVHRDIKPSNILITQEGLAKLVDMGLARLESLDGPDNDETATGVTLGTFDYISPEQARNPKDADTRSDIYSLGCTLFFMLTGRPPFADGSVLQKLLFHQTETPPDVRDLRSDVPDELAAVLTKMLAKRPDERFQNPTELSAGLLHSMEQIGVAAPAVAIPAYRFRRFTAASWWRRHAAWLVPSVLLLLSVLVLGVMWNREAVTTAFPEPQIPDTMAADGAGFSDSISSGSIPAAGAEPSAGDPADEFSK